MQNDDERMLGRIRQQLQVNLQSELESEPAAAPARSDVDMESSQVIMTGPSYLGEGVIGGELGLINSASAVNHGQLLDQEAAVMHLLYGHVMQQLAAGSTPPLSSSSSSSPIAPPIYTTHSSIFTNPIHVLGSAAGINFNPMDDYNNTAQLISLINANSASSMSSTANTAINVMNRYTCGREYIPSPLTTSYSSTANESLTVIQPSTHVALESMADDQQLLGRDYGASDQRQHYRESAFRRWNSRDHQMLSSSMAGDYYNYAINAPRDCSYGRGSLLKRCLREVVPCMGMQMQMMMHPMKAEMADQAGRMMGSPRSFSSASDPQHPTNVGRVQFTGAAQQQEEAARQHMMAERNRRRKLNEHFKTLKSIIPPIHQPKRDKVSILENAILYMRQLQDLVQDLQEKATAPIISREVVTHTKMGSNVSGNDLVKNSRENLQSQRSIIVSDVVDSKPPLFKLELDVTLPSVDQVNITMVHVHNILEGLKLKCVTSNTNFDFATSQLKASIYAQHENHVGSSLPNPKDIQAEFLKHL